MEEAIARLLKVAIKTTLGGEWASAEELTESILQEAELALHPETRRDIVDYIKTL